MSAHTKGPWESAAREGDDWESVVYVPGTPYEICQCFHSENIDECEANARLIAAAPELLEALVLVLPMAKGYAAEHPVGRNQEIVNEVQAALNQTKTEVKG